MVKLEEIYELTKDLLKSVEDLKTEIKVLKENINRIESLTLTKLHEIDEVKKELENLKK